MSEQPSAFLQVDTPVSADEMEQIKARWLEHYAGQASQVIVLPQPDPDFPDAGRHERKPRRERRAEKRRQRNAQLQADIIRLERELGITDQEVPKQIDGIPVTSLPDPGRTEKR